MAWCKLDFYFMGFIPFPPNNIKNTKYFKIDNQYSFKK